jgi:hypothetical protein
MKTFLRLFLTSLLLVPAALSAASFEGKVSFKMTSGKGQPQEINYSIKGDKVRMAMPGVKGSGGMIMDTTKKEMLMIMDEQKAYMVMALPQTAIDAMAKQNDDVKLEKTDETEKILGYTATKYIVTSKEGITDLWLAEGLGTFVGFSSNPMGGKRGAPPKAWEQVLAGKELFPMRVVGMEGGGSPGKGKGDAKGKGKGNDRGGKETFRMEVTAIEKTSLPDSLFNPPAGYQKFDMGGMMKGMIPGAR